MGEVSIRDLTNDVGEIIDRVTRGETVIVTRSGKAVAELRPVPKQPVSVEVLIDRRRRLPAVDPVTFKVDIDSVLDTEL